MPWSGSQPGRGRGELEAVADVVGLRRYRIERGAAAVPDLQTALVPHLQSLGTVCETLAGEQAVSKQMLTVVDTYIMIHAKESEDVGKIK